MGHVKRHLSDCAQRIADTLPLIDQLDIVADAGLEHEISDYMAPLLPILAPINRDRAIAYAFTDALMSGVIPDRIYWPVIFQTLGNDDARFLLQLPETGPTKELTP